MVPDGRTDGMDGRTHGRRQNYIPPTSSGDNNAPCVYTEVMVQDDTVTFVIKPRLIFSFFLCLRLASPNYAFMRCRLYSKRKVKEYQVLANKTGVTNG